MYSESLNAELLAALDRPDLRVVSNARRISFDAGLGSAFRVDNGGEIILGATCLGSSRACAFHIRHALELSMLLEVVAGTDERTTLAGLCAARTASLFWQLDGPSGAREPVSWLAEMASEAMPAAAVLARVWAEVGSLQAPAGPLADAMLSRLQAIWPLLGPAESLMARGGDARLAVDPRTGLNHYGCSHRPRPWAITFASSTASSLSERGFGGAEASRRRIAAAALSGQGVAAATCEAALVRKGIAAHYGLPAGCEVVLAASGTDCELVVLALAERLGAVGSILTAPEETGTGVPLAAGGMHFAADTSGRQQVRKGGVVAGFRADTRVVPLAIRATDGTLRPAGEIEAECAALAQAQRDDGRRVLLHLLDLSKTGLLAPSVACLERLQALHGDSIDIVVDACQARLDQRRVRDYLGRGWMVMITGSKFFTGPPFCGAVLLPPGLVARLAGPERLPPGLSAYGGKADWPEVAAAANLPEVVNLGMVLRWQAALAEMQAFGTVPAAEVRERLGFFLGGICDAIDAHPSLVRIDVPAPKRAPLSASDTPSWDQLQTIVSFLVLEAGAPVPLSLERARLLYRWLNADVSGVLPAGTTDEDRRLGGTLCHVGQPAPVRHPALGDLPAGALRLSAGARLLSGEPSHEGLDVGRRLAREVSDARRILDKITLLLRHWAVLQAADPEPSYAPHH